MIGERLKEVRSDYGDTQQMLADKLKVSNYTVQSWEQEKSSPSHELLVTICRLYHVSSDFLLGLNETDPIFLIRNENRLTPENMMLLKDFGDYLLTKQKNEL